MTAGDDQDHARGGQGSVLQGVRGDVPGEVVHPVQRRPGRVGEGLRPGQADLVVPGEAGAGGDGGGGVDPSGPQTRPVERLPDDRGFLRVPLPRALRRVRRSPDGVPRLVESPSAEPRPRAPALPRIGGHAEHTE
ncbi:hypothetical protein GCM10010363_39910 [Streptomyces omiyaensis]|nr:hypothetical protein GCM10010363_39910 [Streptomyces omiyaensis]